MCLTAICRSFYKRKKLFKRGNIFKTMKNKKSIEMLDWRYCFRRWPETKKCFAPANIYKNELSFFCTRKVNNLIKVYSPCLVFFFLMIILTIKKHPPNVSKEEQIKYIIVTSSQLCQQRSIHYLQFRWHKAISEW